MDSAETSGKSGLICSFLKILISVPSNIVAVLEREQKALPAKKAAFLSSAMVRMWVWASSMVILHPCMELDPTLRLAFWRAELSLAVMGSDRVCPILHTKFGFWSLLTHFHSFLFLLTPLHWNDHWLCHFLLSITQKDNTKKIRCSSTHRGRCLLAVFVAAKFPGLVTDSISIC